MRDDAELMKSTARGDENAFRQIVERYQKEIFNFFLRITGGNSDDAEDLTQNLFINLYRSASRYKPTSSFRTYIYRIARNLAISHFRSSGGRYFVSIDESSDEGVELVEQSPAVDPVRHVEAGELSEAYKEALMALPDEWRMILELRVGRGLSYKEISEVTGKSVSAVETIIFRARSALVEKLKDFR